MKNQFCRRVWMIVALVALLWSHGWWRKSPQSPSSPRADQSRIDSSSQVPIADNQTRTEHDGMMLINGGKFLMGTEDGMPYETPVHEVAVKSFWMDRHEVTVAEFSEFVLA